MVTKTDWYPNKFLKIYKLPTQIHELFDCRLSEASVCVVILSCPCTVEDQSISTSAILYVLPLDE